MKMSAVKTAALLAVLCFLASMQLAEALKRTSNKRSSNSESSSADKFSYSISDDEAFSGGDLADENRIQLAEPYKSMAQTATRFALAQLKVNHHMNIDTAMDLLSDAGYILSKPANLLLALKGLAVAVAVLVSTTMFFPGAYQFAEATWRNPANLLQLDRYMSSNGISERTVYGLITAKTDNALNRVGLNDYSCREKSLCHLGEMINCTFPKFSETTSRFLSDNFSSSKYRENRYVRAFTAGFTERNCTGIESEPVDSSNCLSNLISSILMPRLNSFWTPPSTSSSLTPRSQSGNDGGSANSSPNLNSPPPIQRLSVARA